MLALPWCSSKTLEGIFIYTTFEVLRSRDVNVCCCFNIDVVCSDHVQTSKRHRRNIEVTHHHYHDAPSLSYRLRNIRCSQHVLRTLLAARIYGKCASPGRYTTGVLVNIGNDVVGRPMLALPMHLSWP